MSTMRAVRLREHGGPEVLRVEEVALPVSRAIFGKVVLAVAP